MECRVRKVAGGGGNALSATWLGVERASPEGVVRRTIYKAPRMMYFAASPLDIKIMPLYELMRHTITLAEGHYP